jgi:hypothetical protein
VVDRRDDATRDDFRRLVWVLCLVWLALAAFTTLAQRYLGWRLAAGLIGGAGALFTVGLLFVAAGSVVASTVERSWTAEGHTSMLRRLLERFGLARPAPQPPSQAVLVHLDGIGLPDAVYEEYDLATLEDQLTERIQYDGLGECDGHESGPEETTLFLYGADAERLFERVEATLRSYPLCRGARVTIRLGPPGAPEREIRLV